jgi:hypothetical protein
VNDVLAFLTAQLDADERQTRALAAVARDTIAELKDVKLLGRHIPGWHTWPDVEKACRERLLDIAAKRRIVEEFSWEAGETRAVMYLAQAYAGREGWQEEWRSQ